MNSVSCRFVVLLFSGVLVLSSCGSQHFYSQVEGEGVIVGRPSIDWIQPDKFVYDRDKNQEFRFVRPNGEIVTPGTIETDGGSIPRALWSQNGFSPWTYAPAYLVHDWIYEAHRRGEPAGKASDGSKVYYSKEQADWIIAEVIKSQMENGEEFNTERSPGRLKKIYWAVSRFGETAWNEEARPVSTIFYRPVQTVFDNLPFQPVMETLQNELTLPSAKPRQKGYSTPQP